MGGTEDERNLVDLEIRIFQRVDRGYPVEITLAGQQEFPRGYLSPDISPWISGSDLTADGQKLFGALFSDPVLHDAWIEARGSAPQRRIRLQIDPAAPELHELPWELLCEGEVMLAANAATPFSRYLPVSIPWGRCVEERPLRVLAVISNPHDLQALYDLPLLDVDLERSILEEAFLSLQEDAIQLDFLDTAVTLERLEEALHGGYHVLHYVGHGVFNKRRGQAALYLQDEEGDTQVVRDEALIGMLQRQAVRPRLVFLAACQSGARSSADAFVGLAPRLVAAGVPAVVAMQELITVKTARKVSLAFYRRLVEHGMVDCALNEARSLLLTSGRCDAAVPVLFMRLKSGQLWEEEGEEPERSVVTARVEIPPPPKPELPPVVARFVGREEELAAFRRSLEGSGVAVITGMPGMGKTAVAAILASQAAEPEKVFWHSFHENEGIAELVWKLAGFLFWHGDQALWTMLQGTRLSGGQLPPMRELLDYLVQMAAGKGYLFCLDDLHFLPEDDMGLLDGFAQRLLQKKATFVIASQSVPAFAHLSEVAPLTGLDMGAVHCLLEARGLALPGEVEAELYHHTGGNVQFLTLAINALCSAGDPLQIIHQLAETKHVERYLMTEVDKGLTDEERKVMSGLSVLLNAGGTRDAIEVVLDAGGLRRALSSLSQRSLVETRGGEHGTEYIQNAMLRDFYYSFLGRSERRAMHHRAALYYETEEPDLLKAAQHFLRAGEDEQALTLVTEAVGDLINKGQARPLLSLLKEVDVSRVGGMQRVKVRMALSQVQVTFGDYASAQEVCQKALSELALLPKSDETQGLQSHACRWLARIYELRSEYGEALYWVHQGLFALQGQENSEAIELHLMAGLIHVRQGHYAEALDECRQGLRIAQTVNAPAVLARAYNLLGVIHLSDTTQLAIDPLQRAIALYEQVGDIRGQATSFNLMAGAYFNLGQWDQAEAYYRKSCEIFEKVGDAYHCIFARNNLGGIALNQGRLDEALDFYQQALGMLEQNAGSPYVRGVLHNNLGAVYIQRGELEAAEVHLQTGKSCFEQAQSRDILPELYRLFAEVDLVGGKLGEAKAHGEQALLLARELAVHADEGKVLRVLGEISLARGELAQAAAYLQQSLELLEKAGETYEKARSQLVLAVLYVRQGYRQMAALVLDQCIPTFEHLGAARDLMRARALKTPLDAES